jgi:hypothetical protein
LPSSLYHRQERRFEIEFNKILTVENLADLFPTKKVEISNNQLKIKWIKIKPTSLAPIF